jgi:glycosyltransferase involved in cell wall biosynthesis
MRILVATGIYPPQIGGPATYSKLIYDELPKRGIAVEVASFGEFIDRPWGVRHLLYFISLIQRASDVDIVYAQDPVSVGLPALIASQIRGKKFVVKIVGDYAWEQGRQRFGVADSLDDFSLQYDSYSWQVKMLKKIEKYVADGAVRIVTPSEYLKSIITRWGVDAGKISVVHNGFHIDPIAKTPSALRRALGLSGRVIVSVGRLVPWKGMGVLVEAFSQVRQSIPLASLVIIGDGPEMENLKLQATSYKLQDFIRFTGRLEQGRAFEYVKSADVFALNTSYEGFSHQLLETMALGTPIVTTRVGGNVEVIHHEENGLFATLDDKDSFAREISRLLSDDALASRLARKAKRDVSMFTDEIMLDKLVGLLKDLVSHNS